MEDNPNINKNGNVVFTFFAGIESINSMVQLDSLKPLKRVKTGKNNPDEDDNHAMTARKNKNDAAKVEKVVNGEES